MIVWCVLVAVACVLGRLKWGKEVANVRVVVRECGAHSHCATERTSAFSRTKEQFARTRIALSPPPFRPAITVAAVVGVRGVVVDGGNVAAVVDALAYLYKDTVVYIVLGTRLCTVYVLSSNVYTHLFYSVNSYGVVSTKSTCVHALC